MDDEVQQKRSISATIKAEWARYCGVIHNRRLHKPAQPAAACAIAFNGSETIGNGETLSLHITPNQPGKMNFKSLSPIITAA